MKTYTVLLIGMLALLLASCTSVPQVHAKGFQKPINNGDIFSFDEESLKGDTFRQAMLSGRLVPARCHGEIILTSPNHPNVIPPWEPVAEFGGLTVSDAVDLGRIMLQLRGRHTSDDRTVIVFVH